MDQMKRFFHNMDVEHNAGKLMDDMHVDHWNGKLYYVSPEAETPKFKKQAEDRANNHMNMITEELVYKMFIANPYSVTEP